MAIGHRGALDRLDEAGRAALARRLRERRGASGPAPIPRLPAGAPAPASHAQQRMWLAQQANPDDTSHNVMERARITGPFEPRAFAAALDALTERHEALRTVFAFDGSTLLQRVLPPAPIGMTVADLRFVPEADRDRRVAEAARRHMATAFDLTAGPLVRSEVLRLGQEDHWWLFSTHHIACDGRSIAVLVEELSELYAAVREQRPPALPEPAPRYADYAAWQRGRAWPPEDPDARYWTDRLADAAPSRPFAPDLPGDRTDSATTAKHVAVFPPAAADRLIALGRSLRATPFMMFLAVFQVLQHHYCGSGQVWAGVPVSVRRPELDRLVGPVINTLPIGTAITADMRFDDVVRAVRDACTGALAHRDMPIEAIAERAPHVDLQRLTGSLFSMRSAPPPLLATAGLTVRFEETDRTDAKSDLTVEVDPDPEGLRVRFGYRPERHTAAAVERLADHFGRILAAAAAGTTVDRLLTVPTAPRPLQAEPEPSPPAPSLIDAFAAQARKDPAAVAISHGQEHWTYGELDRRSADLASRLRGMGVGPDAPVALYLDPGPDLICALLAALRAGGCYVPIDPAAPAERAAAQLADTAALAVCTTSARLPDLPGTVAAVLLDAPAPPPPTVPTAVPAHPGDLAYVLHTSGSTGRPNGVMVTRAGLDHYVAWAAGAYGYAPGETSIVHTSTAFDLTVTSVLPPLTTGGRLLILPAGADAEDLADALADETAGVLKATPAHLGMLEALRPGGPAPRCLVVGGEALHWNDVESWRDRVSSIVNEYGPTETVVGCSTHTVGPPVGATVPIGRPIDGTALHVLGPGLLPRPVGVPGELYIGGPGVARGYAGRPGLTAERFVPDPFAATGARMYRTGDRARRLEDGSLEFLGRIDEQLNVRGHRIEPGEIEAALRAAPGVDAAAAVATESGLEAHVTGTADPEALLRRLRDRLPSYMVPGRIRVHDSLPLTPHGKVDRSALRASAAAAAVPGDSRPTGLAGLIAEVWEEVLGTAPGPDDDLFASGGDSLTAARVAARLSAVTGRTVGIRTVFEAPTPRALQAVLTGQGDAGAPPPVGTGPEGPASFAQERMWVLYRVDADGSAYNNVEAVRITGELDRGRLRTALDRLAERHDILRTVYAFAEGELTQRALPAAPVRLTETDLSAAADPETALAETLDRLGAAPFALDTEPPFRAALIGMGDRDHVLALVLHHIATDGWTVDLLRRDLELLYTADDPPAPTTPAVTYRDYAAWQRGLPTDDRDLEYWRRHLAGAPAHSGLRADRTATGDVGGRADRVAVHIGAATAARLKGVARECGATAFMVLLAGFGLALGRAGGQDDLLIGTPVSGRERPELEAVAGLFVNTLVLRARLRPGMTLRELIGDVRQTALAAFDHQRVPFERLVDELAADRASASPPLVQTMFTVRPAWRPQAAGAGGPRFAPVAAPSRSVKFDLLATAAVADGGIELLFEYDADRFARGTVERLLEDYRATLTAMPEALDLPIAAPAPAMPAAPAKRIAVSALHTGQATSDPPHSDMEHLVAKVWGDLLGVPIGDRRADFFTLGGNSLLLLEAHRRIGAELGIELAVIELFRRPTVAGLAEYLESPEEAAEGD